MKRLKKEYLKTEASVQKTTQQREAAKDWVLCSNQRQKRGHQRGSCTPLRFAEIKSLKNGFLKQQPSTKDREQSSIKPDSTFRLVKHEAAEAINLLRKVGNIDNFRIQQAPTQISPFVLNPHDTFEQQISFKGVSNKFSLIQIADTIERQATQLLSQMVTLKSSLDLPLRRKYSRVYQRNEKPAQASLSSQLSGLIEAIQSEFSDFLVELNRCRQIMRMTTGITDKNLNFYKSRFQSLIEGFSSKVSCLRKYLDIQKQNGKERIKIKVSRLNGS